jgi:hypothetical protein
MWHNIGIHLLLNHVVPNHFVRVFFFFNCQIFSKLSISLLKNYSEGHFFKLIGKNK